MESLKENKPITATLRKTINELPVGSLRKEPFRSKSIMWAAIKARPIKVRFCRGVPVSVLRRIALDYSEWIDYIEPDEQVVNWDDTEIFKTISEKLTPGKALSSMRQAHGFTQKALCAKLGNKLSSKRLSDWENGHRSISKEWAKRLSEEFLLPVKMFL
jgi:hypothetical protein